MSAVHPFQQKIIFPEVYPRNLEQQKRPLENQPEKQNFGEEGPPSPHPRNPMAQNSLEPEINQKGKAAILGRKAAILGRKAVLTRQVVSLSLLQERRQALCLPRPGCFKSAAFFKVHIRRERGSRS